MRRRVCGCDRKPVGPQVVIRGYTRPLFTNPWVRKMKIDSRTARAAAGEDVREDSCITEEFRWQNLLFLY